MTVRIGINGFGRIGRNYLRSVLARAGRDSTEAEVVAVNDIAPTATLAHLLEYDSTYGRLGRTITHDAESITIDGPRIAVTAEPDLAALTWGEHGVRYPAMAPASRLVPCLRTLRGPLRSVPTG
jgi:glyceraldehyde 3-phosphate dehydrogenase